METPLTKAEYERSLALQEVERLVRCRDSLVEFVKYMKTTGEKDFAHDPTLKHHLVIYQELQDFADDVFDNLLLLMPPGAGKSMICSVQFPLWWWIRNLSHNVLAASNTQELANEFSRRRRSCMLTEEYKRFGVKLTKESVDNQQNDKGGTMSCHGMMSSVVGRRSNLNITDDPIMNSEQAASQTQLEKLMTWYDVDFRSRKVKGAKELIVTTRWARQDPAGILLDRIEKGKEKGWKVIRLPLICDSEDDPVGRKIGQQLWPGGFDKSYIRNAKRDPLVFQTTYQQLPYIQDGDWVGDECIFIKKGTPDISQMKIVIGCDLALTQGGKADYTVFSVVGIHSGHFHILDIKRNRNTPSDSVKVLFDLCEQYPQARELLLDDDAASKVFKELILTELRQTRRHIHIAPVMMPMRGLDKESRAVNLRSLFHQRRVSIWQREWTPILVQEIMGFPDGCKHDDMIDALGLVAKRAVKMGNFNNAPAPGNKVDNALITDREDEYGRRISNMTLDSLYQQTESPKLSIVRRRI